MGHLLYGVIHQQKRGRLQLPSPTAPACLDQVEFHNFILKYEYCALGKFTDKVKSDCAVAPRSEVIGRSLSLPSPFAVIDHEAQLQFDKRRRGIPQNHSVTVDQI